MKILEIIYTIGYGGAEQLVIDLCNKFSEDKENKVELCLIVGDCPGNKRSSDAELSRNLIVTVLGHKNGLNARSLFQIFNIIRKSRPDVVHFHLTTVVYGLIPALLFRKIKFVHTIHSSAARSCSPFLKHIIKFFYKNNLIVPVTISQESKISLRDYFGFDNSFLITNGRALIKRTDKFPAVGEELSRLKRYDDDKVYIHVSRYHEIKNQRMLVEVFNKLYDEGEHLMLIILGKGYETGEGALVRSMAGKGVHFLGGKDNVSDYLYCSDTFCMTSFCEGLPISLLEALSCGVTPICTPAGGIVNVLINREIGVLTKGFEFQEYYDAIKKSLRTEKSKEQKEFLVNYFLENYSIDKCSQEYIELWAKL